MVRPESRHGGERPARLPAHGLLRGAQGVGEAPERPCSRRWERRRGSRGPWCGATSSWAGTSQAERADGQAVRASGRPCRTLVLDAALGARIRREIGLDRAHILITAAAPIHPDLLRWLHAIGLPVIELYGQTEVCGPTTCNPPEDNRVGTVGRALPGVRVRIAEDGEILVQGGNVCAGYFNDPAEHIRAARHRRLDALGRPGNARRRRVSPPHRAEEGPHHHRRRTEHRSRRTSRWS